MAPKTKAGSKSGAKSAVKSSSKNTGAASHLTAPLLKALMAGALPGEGDGFDKKAAQEAAAFMLQISEKRKKASANVAVETFTNISGKLAMRVAVNNDDMPFLVDSVAAALASAGVAVDRLIHPVLFVDRDSKGALTAIGTGARRESFIYFETSRLDAKERRDLADHIHATLTDIRCAVDDWRAMTAAVVTDADRLPKGSEESALMRWFADGNMTLLGHENIGVDGARSNRLGLSRASEQILITEESTERAVKLFKDGGQGPLLLKSTRISSVHRAVQLDLIVLPTWQGKKLTGLSVTAGLWTSAALAMAPGRIPVLRTQLDALMRRYGFDPGGHAGKSMAHAMTQLPHDILLSFAPADLERTTLTAMSLIDRPRPKLLAVRSALRRHIFVFVWLPRDDVSTGMRRAIEAMLVEAVKGPVLSWSITLEDGGVALLRYVVDVADRDAQIDEGFLDQRLKLMVRGWEPAVENALAAMTDAGKAAAIVARYASGFPQSYRTSHAINDAALDMLALVRMEMDHSRICRLTGGDGAGALHLKVYNEGGALPLSDVVPVLENFGFDVVEQVPTALDNGTLDYIHDFAVKLRGDARAADILARGNIIETALSQVLDGKAENDVFNQLITIAALPPQSVIWLRAWYRYLRQTGLTYGMPTVVAALNKHGAVVRAIVQMFTALHDPAHKGDRQAVAKKLNAEIDAGLSKVSAIDEDRLLRLFRAVVLACLRTNAFAPAAAEALAFKLESAKKPGLPAPQPWREVFV